MSSNNNSQVPNLPNPTEVPSKSHSFFNTVANYAVSGYDKATNYVTNDAVKGVLVSQRGNFETMTTSAASVSTQAVEAISRGAQKVVTGDHAFQPEPLPNWLNPRDPILSVPGSLPFLAVYAGIAIFHQPLSEMLNNSNGYSLLFFSVPKENETHDPKFCGPMVGYFEPRFGKILCKVGILKQADVNCAASSDNSPAAGNSRVNLLQQVAEYNRTHQNENGEDKNNNNNNNHDEEKKAAENTSAPDNINNNEKTDKSIKGGNSTSGFDMISDWNLGGTVKNPPNNKNNNNISNNKVGVESIVKDDDDEENDEDEEIDEKTRTIDNLTFIPHPATSDTKNETTNVNSGAAAVASPAVDVTSPALQNTNNNNNNNDNAATTITPAAKLMLGLKKISLNVLEALHPNFLFTVKKDIMSNEEVASPRVFISYHTVSAAFFAATAVTSFLGLRRVAKRKGVDVNTMIPPLARMAKDVLPLSLTGGIVERFGHQPADLSSTLQFGMAFGAFGAIFHMIPAITQFLKSNLIDEVGRNNNNNNNNNNAATIARVANQNGNDDGNQQLSSVSNSSKIVKYSTLTSHYTSLIFDLNIALQLCVLSPSLPPIVKLWPALYFTLVTRKFYLCDDQHTTSYFGSHSRWILFAGAFRHFAMLCESTPKNNNFAAHVFPRLFSLALLPIHLAAFWLPMHPARSFDEQKGGLLRTMFGGMTGTAWSPAALSVCNLAWAALYFSQGTNSMDDACPRVQTMGGSTLPVPLYLAGVEIVAALGKLLSQVV